jgi:hypothetical protein
VVRYVVGVDVGVVLRGRDHESVEGGAWAQREQMEIAAGAAVFEALRQFGAREARTTVTVVSVDGRVVAPRVVKLRASSLYGKCGRPRADDVVPGTRWRVVPEAQCLDAGTVVVTELQVADNGRVIVVYEADDGMACCHFLDAFLPDVTWMLGDDGAPACPCCEGDLPADADCSCPPWCPENGDAALPRKNRGPR